MLWQYCLVNLLNIYKMFNGYEYIFLCVLLQLFFEDVLPSCYATIDCLGLYNFVSVATDIVHDKSLASSIQVQLQLC